MNRRPYVSFSEIEQWYNCARQFYYDRVQPVPSAKPAHPALLVGQLYHNALSRLLSGDILDFREHVEASADSFHAAGALMDVGALTRELGENVLRVQQLPLWPQEKVPAEQHFQHEELRLIGIIDAVLNCVPITRLS